MDSARNNVAFSTLANGAPFQGLDGGGQPTGPLFIKVTGAGAINYVNTSNGAGATLDPASVVYSATEAQILY